MAEALVSDLLKQLASIDQGIRLVVGVEEEVGRLERYLQTIQPMLDAAEKQQVNWLDDLKDACYQIDDVLDEWNTAMIKSEIEKEEEKAASEIEKEEQKAANRPVAQLVVSPYDFFFGDIESLDPDFSKEEQKASNRPVAQRVESFRDYFPPSIESLDPDLSKEEQKAEKTPVLKDKVRSLIPSPSCHYFFD